MIVAEIFVFMLSAIVYYLVIAPILTIFFMLMAILGEIPVNIFERTWSWPIHLMRAKRDTNDQ